uniref:B30.2/SPRY domain-containing protein n=1 Tax=Oreochromis aureus TaxID=47969 RepID=A0AAZ1Y3F2_OREAU
DLFFLCSICLDVFTDPVTTPCGHNFCKNSAKPGEVPCDYCTGTRLRALKSCLVCLTSYCETHLEPHLTIKGLKRHQLIEPVENLEGRMCTKHDKHLELFCKTDQTCVCTLCSVLDHKTHEFTELRKMDDEIQEMIEKRRQKIQEINESVKMSKDAADKQKTEGVQIFTVLKEFIEKGLKKVIKEIEDKQETTEKQAEGLIKELEEEISELKKRSSELKQASRSEDHLHFIQSFSSLKAVPPTKDWTEVIVLPPTYEGTVMRAVAQLEETLKKHFKKLLAKAELRRVQQYAVDVSLDPDTAHPELILSDDGKQVNFGDVNQSLSDNPKRFTVFANVLGRQGFSSGRFYFEVQVKGKTDWILGVARESVNRKGGNSVKPQDGFWALWLRNNNEYTACTGPAAVLSLASAPDKVGVFVDYEERLGVVSIYDVDAAALIYSFTGCSFTEKLYPYFNPCNNDNGKNSAPLLITPINHTE